MTKRTYYFGFLSNGHHLYDENCKHVYNPKDRKFPWHSGLLDTGLLKNGNHPDVYDGKVFSTAGGVPVLWIAFFWWDRSGDKRPGSNSGFYVQGFEWDDRKAAFDYACNFWQGVVKRQKFPLILQDGR